MTFVHTAILGAAGLAVAPIIIHLLMRSKPRLVIFPALRFVRVTHNANVTRHRIKHLLLLLMRMAAIAILAFILARPQIETTAGLSLGAREPVSAVVVIDTSGSMAYRVAGQPRLADAKQLATRLLEDIPDGSQTAALWPDRPGDKVPLSPDTRFTLRQIQELTDQAGRDPDAARQGATYRTGQRASMVPLLQRAYRSLANAPTSRREIYVFNDRTRDSWGGLAPGTFDNEYETTVYLLDLGANENQDFLAAAAEWDAQLISPRRAPILSVAVRPGELTGRRVVEVEMDGRAAGRQQIDLPDKLSPATVRFKIAPMAPGLHAGRVRLVGQDEIIEDNVRFVALEVGPPPQVLMIEARAAGGEGWPIGDLVEAVLAPRRRVVDGTALVDLVRLPAADFLIKPAADQQRLDKAHAVILADVGVLGEQQWDALKNYVGSGGTLITLLGANCDAQAFSGPPAAAVLPAPGIGRRIRLGEPGRAAFPNFEKGASRVLTSYHRHDKSPLIDRELIFQYYPLPAGKRLPPNTQPLIELAGPSPAPLLLERRLGAGYSLMLTTSPQADWSEWSQAATWPVLLFAMTTTYNRGVQRAYHFVLDQPAAVTLPPAFRAGSATVTLPDGRGRETYVVGASTGAVALPTRHLGHYRVELQAPGGATQELLYAVNFDPVEYSLAKIDPEELTGSFPPNRFMVVNDPAGLERSQARARASREDIGALIGLALLILLIGESFFSNRFYRVATSSPTASAAPQAAAGAGTPAGQGE